MTPTGLTPGPQKHVRNWAPSFIGGLVGPSAFAPSKCPHGVATFETKVNFAQGTLWVLSYFIYTPKTQVVTCAAEPVK